MLTEAGLDETWLNGIADGINKEFRWLSDGQRPDAALYTSGEQNEYRKELGCLVNWRGSGARYLGDNGCTWNNYVACELIPNCEKLTNSLLNLLINMLK